MNNYLKIEEIKNLKKAELFLAISVYLFLFLSLIQDNDDLFRTFFFLGIIPTTILLLFKYKNLNKIYKSNTFISALLLLLFLFFSSFTAETNSNSIEISRVTRWYLSTSLFFIGLFLYGFLSIQKLSIHTTLLQTTIILSTLLAIFYYIVYSKSSGRISAQGLLDHPILSSSVLISIWTVSLTGIYNYKNKLSLFFCFFTLILVSLFVYFSQSRGPLITLGLVWLYIIFLVESKKIKVGIVIGVISLLIIALLQFDLAQYIRNALNRSFMRDQIWSAYLSNVTEYFWTGIGINTNFENSPLSESIRASVSSKYSHHPHNIFLATFVQGGIFALMLLIYLIGSLTFKISKMTNRMEKRKYYLILGVTLALTFTDTHKLVSSPQEIWLFFWMPIAILCGCTYRSIDYSKDSQLDTTKKNVTDENS